MEKDSEYAVKIMAQIQEMFDENCENYVDADELAEDTNATDFIYALGSLAPAMIYERLTGDKKDALGFNHLMNRLCAQRSNFVKE